MEKAKVSEKVFTFYRSFYLGLWKARQSEREQAYSSSSLTRP